MKRIYLDYASLTPVDPRVLRTMKRISSRAYANPSSIYAEGVAANKAVEESRKAAAAFLQAHPDEIVFTSGGTEANCLAIEGAFRAARRAGIARPHLIISAIEHSSVMETAAHLEREGAEVSRLPVGADGLVSVQGLKDAIRPDTYLVSLMAVNNETGSVQPVREAAKIVRAARSKASKPGYPLFHTDASQAMLYYDLGAERLGVDLLTLDGAKACGPRGIGALYVRRGTQMEPILHGGGQERGLRSGTENVAAIAGFAEALSIASAGRDKAAARARRLIDDLAGRIKGIRPDAAINPPSGEKAPHILNVSVPGIDNEYLVLQLDAQGIAASTKSSCLRDDDESYVLRAMGADSRSSLRFSVGRWTKSSEIRRTGAVLAKILGF